MADLGHSLVHLGRLDEAEPLLVDAVEETGRLLGPTHELCLSASGLPGESPPAAGSRQRCRGPRPAARG